MDRVDWFYRQKVTEAELDGSQDKIEQSIQNFAADVNVFGVLDEMTVSQHSPTPDLTVDVSGPGVAYDQQGQRVAFSSLQNVDVSQDSNAVSTAVGTPGNENIVSIFIKFDRLLSDPRTDGNSLTVYFQRDESFEFIVEQSGEGTPPVTPPALKSDAILLADITLVYGQTQVLNADIDIARRQDGAGIGDQPADTVLYDGGGNWADGTTNPATNVELQLDKVVNDLATGDGTAKLRYPGNTGNSGDTSAPDYDVSAGHLSDTIDRLLEEINKRAAKNGDLFISTVEVLLETAAVAFEMRRYIGTTTITPTLLSQRARGTGSSPSDVQNDDRLNLIRTSGWLSSAWQEVCDIRVKVDGTPGSYIPGALIIDLATAAAASSEKLRLTNAGHLRPGTTNAQRLGDDASQSGGVTKRWAQIWGEFLFGTEDFQAPTSQQQLVSRHAQNCVLACGYITAQGSNGNYSPAGDHWNIASYDRLGQGNYRINLDQAIDIYAAATATVRTLSSTTQFNIQGGVVSTTTLEYWITRHDDATSDVDPDDQDFMFIVAGRPNTLP